MTATEQSDSRRRELLRQARYEAFVQRTIEANQRAAQKQDELLKRRQRRQLELEWSI